MDFLHSVSTIIPGVQGQILEVLARVDTELSLSSIAELAGVSVSQASRILPRLADLGVVSRREVPPSLLFRLVPESLAGRMIQDLAAIRLAFIDEIKRSARSIRPNPANVTLFGSLAIGRAGAESDVDLLVVRPPHVPDADESWGDSLDAWREHLRLASGNPVNLLEVGADEASRLLRSQRPLWRDIARHGVLLFGEPIETARAKNSA